MDLPRDRNMWGEDVPLTRPQIQPAVSENRLILAGSYFTGTAKQKNNSKTRLSRKPAQKFNKWLFLSQCSHNCCSEAEMGVSRRLGGINCYQNQPRWTRLSWLQWFLDTHKCTRDYRHTHTWKKVSEELPPWFCQIGASSHTSWFDYKHLDLFALENPCVWAWSRISPPHVRSHGHAVVPLTCLNIQLERCITPSFLFISISWIC